MHYAVVVPKNIRCASCLLSELSTSPLSVYTPGRGHWQEHLASIPGDALSVKQPLSNRRSLLGLQRGSRWRGREGAKQRQGAAAVARHPG